MNDDDVRAIRCEMAELKILLRKAHSVVSKGMQLAEYVWRTGEDIYGKPELSRPTVYRVLKHHA